eukprot:365839-Chlamydomonas_euryale.AAC.5
MHCSPAVHWHQPARHVPRPLHALRHRSGVVFVQLRRHVDKAEALQRRRLCTAAAANGMANV